MLASEEKKGWRRNRSTGRHRARKELPARTLVGRYAVPAVTAFAAAHDPTLDRGARIDDVKMPAPALRALDPASLFIAVFLQLSVPPVSEFRSGESADTAARPFPACRAALRKRALREKCLTARMKGDRLTFGQLQRPYKTIWRIWLPEKLERYDEHLDRKGLK
jgi:hypothetical protein